MPEAEGVGGVSTALAYVVMTLSGIAFLVSVRFALKEVIQAAVAEELENDLYVIRNELKYLRDMAEASAQRKDTP